MKIFLWVIYIAVLFSVEPVYYHLDGILAWITLLIAFCMPLVIAEYSDWRKFK
jgi:hypothetical protein